MSPKCPKPVNLILICWPAGQRGGKLAPNSLSASALSYIYLQGPSRTLTCLSQPQKNYAFYSIELSRGCSLLTALIKLTVLRVSIF